MIGPTAFVLKWSEKFSKELVDLSMDSLSRGIEEIYSSVARYTINT